MNDLKKQLYIQILVYAYDERSGGVRALYLLCHTLNMLGFQAYVHPGGGVPSHLIAPTGSDLPGDKVLAIYGEAQPGNVFGAAHVTRFLLNKPGVLAEDVTPTYGPDDFIISFDKSHVPPGRSSFDMFVPLVDRRYYFREEPGRKRNGFVLCSKRKPSQPLPIPSWATPLTLVLPHRPRTHEQLGEIYRSCRAMIAYERSSAIYEALACGCPVIGIPSEEFNPQTYQPRFAGAGITWEFAEDAIAEAERATLRFAEAYREIERSFPEHVETTFMAILQSIVASGIGVTRVVASQDIVAPHRGGNSS
ncbi:hypothetical protein [Devosia sp.]|uniref:hypothetical protein n=1 Tax=Devosia sp. TaxID=1871048 RepID=UPI003BAC8D82